MDWGTFLWTTIGALLTLATLSFLYRDNPFYKIIEHLFVGVSVGYFTMILWYNGLVPTLFDRLADGKWWYILPAILGVMMWFRFSKKLSWISRYPIAVYLGIGTGVVIMLIRNIGGYPEGVMFAILLMNALTPLIDRVCTLTPYGGKK